MAHRALCVYGLRAPSRYAAPSLPEAVLRGVRALCCSCLRDLPERTEMNPFDIKDEDEFEKAMASLSDSEQVDTLTAHVRHRFCDKGYEPSEAECKFLRYGWLLNEWAKACEECVDDVAARMDAAEAAILDS